MSVVRLPLRDIPGTDSATLYGWLGEGLDVEQRAVLDELWRRYVSVMGDASLLNDELAGVLRDGTESIREAQSVLAGLGLGEVPSSRPFLVPDKGARLRFDAPARVRE